MLVLFTILNFTDTITTKENSPEFWTDSPQSYLGHLKPTLSIHIQWLNHANSLVQGWFSSISAKISAAAC
jgi:hypothetical protein